MGDRVGQLDRRRVPDRRLGRRRSSASPTSSASGRRSRSARGSTSPIPVAAWRDHMARLEARAAKLNERRLDAIHYRGPGTDLTVGLLGHARWMSALVPHGGRDRVRPEHADRGGLHDTRLPPRRGHDPLEPAARARRRRHRGPRADVRGRPDRRRAGATTAPSSSAAQLASDERAALPRRARARRRDVARRPDRD